MKKYMALILCLCCLALAGCSPAAVSGSPASAPAATARQTEDAVPPVAQGAAEAPAAAGPPPPEAPLEIDLTSMSATMVYSYVFNMLCAPDDFIGQRFKIQGIYAESYWAQTNRTYHHIIIADTAACCAQGLEFALPDEDAGYPAPGAAIEICGVLGTYEEEGNLYLQIAADHLVLQ